MLIGDKWKVLILRDLASGTKRFGELKISRKYFSKSVNNSIKRYGKNGLIYRTVYAEVPPRVEYTLTETGISLKPILEAMKTWGEAYQMKLSQ